MTVDRIVIAAGNDAVAEGRADSLSAWVNAALTEKVAKERKLAALAQAVAAYEEEFGAISEQEVAEQARADRESAVVVRGSAGRSRRRRQAKAK